MDDVILAELADSPTERKVVENRPARTGLRFSLATLFLWIFGISVVFAVEHNHLNLVTPVGVFAFPAINRKLQIYAIVSRLIAAPVFGIAVAFGVRAIWRLYRGQTTATHPGHWIMYEFFIWSAANGAALPLSEILDPEGSESLANAFKAVNIFLLLVSGILSMCGCLVFHESRWRIFFSVQTVSSALLFFYTGSLLLQKELPAFANLSLGGYGFLLVLLSTTVLSIAAAITLCIAAIFDSGDTQTRDQMHWAGIGMWWFYIMYVACDTAAFAILTGGH